LTFADAAEKARVGESGHAQMAITGLGKVPGERLHPKAAYSRSRLHAGIRTERFRVSKPAPRRKNVGRCTRRRRSSQPVERLHEIEFLSEAG
jgi:hypothetical protein